MFHEISHQKMNKVIILTIIILSLPALCSAQDSLTKKEIRIQESDFLIPGNPWTVEIPLWIPGFAGEFAYGDISIEGEDGVQTPIEPDPPGPGIGDIFSRLFTTNWYLKFFYLTKVSYEQNRVKAQFDMISGAVGNSLVFNYNNTELVKASFRTVNLRLYAGYKFAEVMGPNENFRYEVFAYGGIRTYFQRLQSELNGTSIELDINPVWVEPLIGLENQFTWKRWMLTLQGDYGGLFSQGKQSVQLSANAQFRMGGLTSLKVGWNHLYMDQKNVFLQQDYTIKLTLSGPVMALAFHF
ncbi:MAG: hypothetical protein DRI97_07675, partial [Bacteroidetes bacterium]